MKENPRRSCLNYSSCSIVAGRAGAFSDGKLNL